MKILSAQQIRKADAHTIKNEPIESIDLMERASKAFVSWFVDQYDKRQSILILVGPGNNGGDALAIARLLHKSGYKIEVLLALPNSNTTPDYQNNLGRLPSEIKMVSSISPSSEVIIDGLLGSGLSRKVEGELAEIIAKVNGAEKQIVSIDIASGLGCDVVATGDSIIKPTYTISFQLPKLAFMLADNAPYVRQWKAVDIGLHQNYINLLNSEFHYQESLEIKKLVKKRNKFSHKGSFGHALVVGGSYGKIGAVVLASKACLRSGAGLVTTLLPACGYNIVQTAVPEAMCLTSGEKYLKLIDIGNSNKYSCIGIGPGLGNNQATRALFIDLIRNYKKPMVLDADALNLLAENPELMEFLPENSILTPHIGEFNRLIGDKGNSLEQIKMQQIFCRKHKVIMVLKGAHTSISNAKGNIWFNSTGNPGMATAGSGDVLTGIITSLLAQGYSPLQAAKLGVFLHGKAGDIAKADLGEPSIIASDIIKRIANAFISL